MSTITVEISEERLHLLIQRAAELGISLEDLLLLGISDLLLPPSEQVQRAIDYLLEKNAELYQRLA